MKREKIVFLLLIGLYSCNENPERISPAVQKNTLNAQSNKSGTITGPSSSGVYYGGSVTFNGVSISTFIEAINYNQPVKIGYQMSATFLNNLPNSNSPEGNELSLSLPTLPTMQCPCPDGYNPSIIQPYNHATFLWYPNGTDPQGIFSFPKFDFHFYTITQDERMAIGDANDSKQLLAPDPEYIPSNYYGPVGPVAMMGSHWVDLLSPEFNGGTFTSSNTYGSYNAKVVFQSLTMTRAYLMSSNSINDMKPIRQPLAYQINGWYPTQFHVEKTNGLIRIYLSDFVNTNYASF
jgi:hypothetical protein